MTTSDLVRVLDDAGSAVDATLFGSKAQNLARLRRLGLDVPDAVFLSAQLFTDKTSREWARTLIPRLQRLFFERSCRYLAVRSSATSEDTLRESHAGQYRTEIALFDTPTAVLGAVSRVANSAPGSAGDISVIVQRAIPARHSGVTFSCDPITYARSRLVLSFIEGMGSELVSGRADGRTLAMDQQDGDWRELGGQPGKVVPIESRHLAAIRNALSLLEEEYRHPVDTEWVIGQDGQLYWIQARPVVLPASSDTPLDTTESFDLLPTVVRGHHKLRLREWAIKNGISMPIAVAHVRSSLPTPQSAVTSVSHDSAGTSVVLLYPTLVNGRVQREFSGTTGTYIDTIIKSCQRYSIRRYPTYTDVTAAVNDVIARGLVSSWASIAIDAKVLDAQLTGTISRIEDGYLVEIAQGHFVPKGIVKTQQFVLNDHLDLLYHRAAEQDFALRFVDGRVVHESPIADPAAISEHHAIAVCNVLGGALASGLYQAFEFGILDASNVRSLYLIDTIESDVPTAALTSQAIEAGIISPGFAEGRLQMVEDAGGSDALDHHLHSSLNSEDRISNTVFLVERDSIELLPLIGSLGPNCGILFRSASVLSHLSIVLREKNIPAAVVGLAVDLSPGAIVAVDTVEIERSYAASREVP
jgi:Pyruvate phosphate dikinase, AMP/ATP-binding domain